MSRPQHPRLSDILRDADAGMLPAALANTYDLSASWIYAILREYRPERRRSPRSRTSDLPDRIRRMRELLPGAKQARIAALLGVTRAYVSKVLREPAKDEA